MKLGVCGDSFMSAIHKDQYPMKETGVGNHFTQLIADKLGWDYKTFARGAATNFHIYHQVKQMVKENVDFIVVGFTTYDRIDIPMKYKIQYEVWDFNYEGTLRKDLSIVTDNRYEKDCLIYSDSINNLLREDGKRDVNSLPTAESAEYFKALEYYVKYLYVESKREMNNLGYINSAITLLEKSKIPYIWYSHNHICESGQICSTHLKDIRLNPWFVRDQNTPYPYHTSLESQRKLSEGWLPLINSKINLI